MKTLADSIDIVRNFTKQALMIRDRIVDVGVERDKLFGVRFALVE